MVTDYTYVDVAGPFYFFPMVVCLFAAFYGAYSIHRNTDHYSFFTMPEMAGIVSVTFIPGLNLLGLLWLMFRIHPDNRRKYGNDD